MKTVTPTCWRGAHKQWHASDQLHKKIRKISHVGLRSTKYPKFAIGNLTSLFNFQNTAEKFTRMYDARHSAIGMLINLSVVVDCLIKVSVVVMKSLKFYEKKYTIKRGNM